MIVKIIVRDDNGYLLTHKVLTKYFDDHLNAFSIEEKMDLFTLICVDNLVYYRPYDRQFSYEDTDDQIYIVQYFCTNPTVFS